MNLAGLPGAAPIGGRVVLTGASSGIGRATAAALAAAASGDEPLHLDLLGRDEAALDDVATRVRGAGATADVHAFDLTDDAALRAFAAAHDAPLAALIHSAGAVRLAPIDAAELADLDLQWRVNVRAPYALTQALLARLERGAGRVVFVNSGAGLRAKGGWSQYAATKHALRAVADSVRADLAGRGVGVVSVYPGRVATPMQRAVRAMEGGDYRPEDYLRPEDVALQIVAALAAAPGAAVPDLSVRPA